jgi:peptidoglycan hydrolase CwlO-like protein
MTITKKANYRTFLEKQNKRKDKKIRDLELTIQSLQEDNEGQQTYIGELQERKDQFKEERDNLKQERDELELDYLKQIVDLQTKVINHAEHRATYVPPVYNSSYVNGAATPSITTSSSSTVL